MSPPDGTTTTTADATTATTGTTTGTGTTTATTATTTAGTGTTAQSGTTTQTTGTTTATTTADANKGPWADDWRKTMAKGDEAGIKRLERFNSPEAVFESLLNAQKKIDSGQIRPTLPENATPEQVAEYRKALGVPEAPDKYDTVIAPGHVWGDADKPMLESFTKAAHEANLPPDAVKTALKWYGTLAQQKAQEQQEADASFKNDSLAKLGQKYGGEFKRNIAHVDSYLEEFPEGIKDKVLGARLPNGRLAGSDPDFIDFLFQQAIFKNPIATVMGGNSEAQIKGAEARLNELIKMSGDPNSDYNKGASREALRAEHLKLIGDLEAVKAQKR